MHDSAVYSTSEVAKLIEQGHDFIFHLYVLLGLHRDRCINFPVQLQLQPFVVKVVL